MVEKNTLDLLGKGIALAGFLFTAGTFAYNQYASRSEGRFSKSIALIDAYREDGIRALEDRLSTRLLYYTSGGTDLNNPDDFDAEDFDFVAKETLFGFDGEVSAPESKLEPYLDAILEITDYYARASFCLEARICDADILRLYLCPRAIGFAKRNARLMDWYTDYSQLQDWNRGLVTLVENCR